MSATEKAGTHTWAEQEAAIGNAKSKAAMLSALTLAQNQIDALNVANAPDDENPFATMYDVPTVGTSAALDVGTTAGTVAAGNDARFPSADQKAALGGTSGSPSVTNAYVTDADQRIVSGATTAIYLDCNRTDTYTANGSPDRPFKTLAESIAYVTTQNMAGVAYYATGEYPTAGGTATLPDVPIVIHGNRSSITGSSTFNIPGTYTAKNLDLVGNVNFTSGSGAHFVTLEGQTIDGSVSVDSGVTIYLNNVHITGNYTKAAGSVTYKGFGTTIDGNITGTGTVIEATQVNTDALTTSTVVIVDSLGSLASSITTSTELTYIHGVTSAIQTQLDGKQPLDADLTALAALTGEGYSFRYTDGTWALLTGSSSVSWGAITGTLADQTDLQNALNAKQPLDADLTAIAALTGEGYAHRATDGSWTLAAGSSEISWGSITGTLSSQTDLQTALNAKANTADLGDSALLDIGTTTGTVCAGDDSRLSDARTPTAHASTHGSAGSDPITIAESQVTNLTTDLSAKAPLASPEFTGVPLAPTATVGTNSTQIATTAFVKAAIDTRQPLDADLTAIAALTGTAGLLKKTAADTWTLDTSTYLTTTAAASTYQPLDSDLTAIAALTGEGYAHRGSDGSWTLGRGTGGVSWGTITGTLADQTDLNSVLTAKLDSTTAASTYLTIATASTTYQPLDGDLTEIAGLAGTTGILTKTAANTWTLDTSTYLTTSAAASTYQPLDADLTAIAGLAGTAGLLRKTAADTWSLDTNVYLTGNETITLSGDATGSGTTAITVTLADSGVSAGSYGSATAVPAITVDAKGRVTAVTATSIQIAESQVTNLTTDLAAKADLVEGKVPSSQLPSFVDDVIEVADYASLPTTGETGKIYVTLDTNLTYRWSGTAYVEISQSLALGETSGTAYRGDRGKIAYDFSQATTGVTAGSYGSASSVATFTVDAQGRQTAAANVSIQIAQSQVTDLGTALSAKAQVDNPTFTTGITTPAANITGLTASRALVSDASKNVTASSVTSTELGYVSGVTSAIQTQIDAKSPSITPINAQTGTTYTLVAADAGKIVTCTNASAITVTVPASTFSAGQSVIIGQGGAGQVTLAAGSGMTLHTTTTLKSKAQYARIAVMFDSASVGTVIGERAAS